MIRELITVSDDPLHWNVKTNMSTVELFYCRTCGANIRPDHVAQHQSDCKARYGDKTKSRQPIRVRPATPAKVPCTSGRPNVTGVPNREIVECPLCAVNVRMDRLDSHIERVHTSNEEERTQPPGEYVRCPECMVFLHADRLESHVAKMHSPLVESATQRQLDFLVCPHCPIKVRADRLDSHVSRIHPGAGTETKPEKLTKCPRCTAKLHPARLQSHLEDVHTIGLGRESKLDFADILCPRCHKVFPSACFDAHAIKCPSPKTANRVGAQRPALMRKKSLALSLEAPKPKPRTGYVRCQICGCTMDGSQLRSHCQNAHGGSVAAGDRRTMQNKFERSLIPGGLASGH